MKVSSGMLRRVVSYKLTDVSEEIAASIIVPKLSQSSSNPQHIIIVQKKQLQSI
jgi:hypothetical protein